MIPGKWGPVMRKSFEGGSCERGSELPGAGDLQGTKTAPPKSLGQSSCPSQKDWGAETPQT